MYLLLDGEPLIIHNSVKKGVLLNKFSFVNILERSKKGIIDGNKLLIHKLKELLILLVIILKFNKVIMIINSTIKYFIIFFILNSILKHKKKNSNYSYINLISSSL